VTRGGRPDKLDRSTHPYLILPDTLTSAMTTSDTLKPNVDKRLRAGAIAFVLAALMTALSVFSV
jgi:hypothetical protein